MEFYHRKHKQNKKEKRQGAFLSHRTYFALFREMLLSASVKNKINNISDKRKMHSMDGQLQ